MAVLELEQMTSPEVRAEIDAGRDVIVVPFGAVEQHSGFMPLGTDAILGDEIGRAVADRLDAFLAPTVRVGCSEHHLAFAGTLTLSQETLKRVAMDIVRALARHGFRRIFLLPTHLGNFSALSAAVEELEDLGDVSVVTGNDYMGEVLEHTLRVSEELGVTPGESGAHCGECETSMMLVLRPELVHMDKAEPGYIGDMGSALPEIFSKGVEALAPNGVLGDPRKASAEHGERYLKTLVDAAVNAAKASA